MFQQGEVGGSSGRDRIWRANLHSRNKDEVQDVATWGQCINTKWKSHPRPNPLGGLQGVPLYTYFTNFRSSSGIFPPMQGFSQQWARKNYKTIEDKWQHLPPEPQRLQYPASTKADVAASNESEQKGAMERVTETFWHSHGQNSWLASKSSAQTEKSRMTMMKSHACSVVCESLWPHGL